jgi:WXG100 family type VII secretion target
MTSIVITPENVQKTASDLIAKKGELEDIVRRAKQMVEGLRGEFKGNLANQVFGKWDEVYPSLTKSFESLQTAGDTLKKAGDAFQRVDETRIV